MKAMLRDDQIAILYDIAQSIAFADDKEGEVQTLIVEGYLVKDGDLYELTEMGLKVVEEHVSQLSSSDHPGDG
jgi:predicted transcriptional regulator